MGLVEYMEWCDDLGMEPSENTILQITGDVMLI